MSRCARCRMMTARSKNASNANHDTHIPLAAIAVVHPQCEDVTDPFYQ